jgi:hypothetical protein
LRYFLFWKVERVLPCSHSVYVACEGVLLYSAELALPVWYERFLSFSVLVFHFTIPCAVTIGQFDRNGERQFTYISRNDHLCPKTTETIDATFKK